MNNMNKKQSIFISLPSLVSIFAMVFISFPASALEALNDNELKQVTGQDGLTVTLALPNSDSSSSAVDALQADSLQYIEDGNTITLSSFAMGAVDDNDMRTTDLNGVTTKLDVYSVDDGGTANAGVGLSVDVVWERLALRNRITFDETDTAQTAAGGLKGTLFDWQWSGKGKLLARNTFVSDLLEDNVNSSIGSEGSDDGTGAVEGAYLQLTDNNFNLGNPYINTALMIRDFDATFCLHNGSTNIDASICSAGVTFDSAFASDIGYNTKLGIDGTYGLFVGANRFELDLNFVLAHRTFANDSAYNSFAIDASDPANVQDFFGVEIVGPLQNFIASVNGGGSDGSSGLRFLIKAENDSQQMVNSADGVRSATNSSFKYLQPSIRIYDPADKSTNFYSSNAASQQALRLDNFREFHNSISSGIPALYLPFTLDIVDDTFFANTSINLGSDSEPYNYNLDTLDSPAAGALLTIENNLFGVDTSINGGSGGGVIDLYAEDLNIGTLGTAGNSLGALVASIRNLESKFLFTSSRAIRETVDCSANPTEPACSVDANALISFGGYGKISESGFGWIDTDANTGDKWFLGFRNFGGFIQGDPLKNYLYAAKDHRGISGNDGFLFNLNGHLATTDFSFGISKAYNASDYENVLFDIGDVVDTESLFKARLRFFANAEILLTPIDDGVVGMDATIDFLRKGPADNGSGGTEKQNLIYFVDDSDEGDVEFGLSDFRGAFATRGNIDGDANTGVAGEEFAKLQFNERTVIDNNGASVAGVETLRFEMPLQVVAGQENLPTLSIGFDVQQYGGQAAGNQQELVRAHIPVGSTGVFSAEVWGR